LLYNYIVWMEQWSLCLDYLKMRHNKIDFLENSMHTNVGVEIFDNLTYF